MILTLKNRGLIAFQIDVLDEGEVIVATANYEWFIAAR